MPIYISIRHIAYPTPEQRNNINILLSNNKYLFSAYQVSENQYFKTDYIRKLKYFIPCLNRTKPLFWYFFIVQ